MSIFPLLATFSRGELTPKLHARADIQDYAQSLAHCRNFTVMRHGGIRRRPGFIWINNARDSSEAARVFNFEFSEEQAYALVFNDGYIRFYTLGGEVRQAAQSITAITKANPGVVTYSGADTYANGDKVFISGVIGMTEVNNREFEVANVNVGANTFELSGVNTTSYTTYSSAGTVEEIYEVAHPYAAADLFEIQTAQSGDTIYLAHRDYAPRKLVRTSELSWAISAIAFEDGPYLDEDEQGTYMTPAATGGVTPDMTGLTSPSGTAANDDADADAWEVFDRDTATTINMSGLPAWVSYDFDAAATKIADAYWIQASPNSGDVDNAPTAWNFEGYNGASWIVLDTRNGETGWATGERRYFEFPNEVGYQSYRLYVTSAEASSTCIIAEIGIHEEGDSQTAFNLTASAITGINGSTGFQTTDVDRTIRLMGTDGKWRWARIVSRTNTTVVTIRLYGHALPNLDAITRWQLSSWSASDGYPSAVGFFEDRLGWGGSTTEPLKIWLSKSSDYEDHGISDPVADSDGINVRMTGGKLNIVEFLEELDLLIAGTAGSMRVIGPTDAGLPFSNTNIKQKANGQIGAAAIQPVTSGVTMFTVDRYGKKIYEFAFDLNANSYVPREASIESDHLFLDGITEGALQQDPDNISWWVIGNGRAAAMTFEYAQKLLGFTDIRVSGGGTAEADIKSVDSIPSADGDTLYAIVERTIDSGTVKAIEYLAPFFETGDTLADAVYADSAGTYDGSAVSSVAGLWYLRGETVGVMLDGIDYGDVAISSTGVLTIASITVHSGSGLTLPSTASTITWGKRYTSRAQTLRAPSAGQRDGTGLGRRMAVNEAKVDMLDTYGLLAGTLQDTRACPRANDTRAAAAGSLNTGMFDVPVIDKHDNNGVVVLTTDKMYPATIRGIVFSVEGEP